MPTDEQLGAALRRIAEHTDNKPDVFEWYVNQIIRGAEHIDDGSWKPEPIKRTRILVEPPDQLDGLLELLVEMVTGKPAGVTDLRKYDREHVTQSPTLRLRHANRELVEDPQVRLLPGVETLVVCDDLGRKLEVAALAWGPVHPDGGFWAVEGMPPDDSDMIISNAPLDASKTYLVIAVEHPDHVEIDEQADDAAIEDLVELERRGYASFTTGEDMPGGLDDEQRDAWLRGANQAVEEDESGDYP